MIEFEMSKPKKGGASFDACVYIEDSWIYVNKKTKIHPFAASIYTPELGQFEVMKAV